MATALDKNGDGKIEYDEFVNWVCDAKKEALMPFLGKAYFALCKEVNIRSLTLGEFSSMIITLSDQGMLNVSKARDTAKRKVSLRVNEKNILFALQEVRLFRCLLEGLVDA